VTYDLLQALMTPKAPRSLNANPDVLSIKHAAGSKIPFTKQEIQDILHEEIRKAA